MRISDWSSDVCSSDLYFLGGLLGTGHHWYFNGQTQVNLAISALFSALEVVPLTLLTLDAWDFVRTTQSERDEQGQRKGVPNQWTIYFLMTVEIGRASCGERGCQYV